MATPDPSPSPNSAGELISLLDYRVSAVEKRLDVELHDIHTSLERINSIILNLPALIDKKLSERGSFWLQIGTLLAAGVAAYAAIRGVKW